MSLMRLWNIPYNPQPKCPQGASAGVERTALPRGVGASSPHPTSTIILLPLWNIPYNPQPKCPQGALSGVERPKLPRGVGASSPHTNQPFCLLLYPYKIALSYYKIK